MEEEAQQKPLPGKPSQVPSWITLGFVLGALSILVLPKPAPAPPPRPAVEEAPKPAKAPEAPRMTTIEAVFTEWDKFAVWNDDRTEVALWDSDTKSFSDCYEVVRNANGYFFRSIPGLTQPLLTHGVAENSPLQFTETARQRQEWIDAVSRQNWNAIAQGAHDALNPTPKPEEGK